MHFLLGQKAYLIQALSLLASGIYLQGVFFLQNLIFVSMFVGGSLTIKSPIDGIPNQRELVALTCPKEWCFWLNVTRFLPPKNP